MKENPRYDRFQREAVEAICQDFAAKPSGRFLLVVPTGGGKTVAAAKAVQRLYESEVLDRQTDRVCWVAHRRELLAQAEDTFEQPWIHKGRPLRPLIDFVMIASIKTHMQAARGTRLVVIDEAHHSAAASYAPFFEHPFLGILGLTATPSRYDGKPLQFDRESFSIGFPDLVEIGVLLRPTILKVEGSDCAVFDLSESSLSQLNNSERNQSIIESLKLHKHCLHKIVIYAATIQHCYDLYKAICESTLSQQYSTVAYITGSSRRRCVFPEGRELEEPREEFISAIRKCERAIILNVDVLSEGYDDPKINAVVMARPTQSKLIYMQAIGRAVRLDPENPAKEAFILEVTDALPNIQYRIDNRWLYSDITDSLETAVVDEEYSSPENLMVKLDELLERYNCIPTDGGAPDISPSDRVTVLLFKAYAGAGAYLHIPLITTNSTRLAATNLFNFLAQRIPSLAGTDPNQTYRAVRAWADLFPVLRVPRNWQYVFQAVENSWELVRKDPPSTSTTVVRDGAPWTTLVCFRLHKDERSLDADLLEFTSDMTNRETVIESILAASFSEGFILAKFPLPLSRTVGVFLSPYEFEQIDSLVQGLRPIKDESNAVEQWEHAMAMLGAATLPIPQRLHLGLFSIVREDLDYFRRLSRKDEHAL